MTEGENHLKLVPEFERPVTPEGIIIFRSAEERRKEDLEKHTEELNERMRKMFTYVFSFLPLDDAVSMWLMLGAVSIEEAAEKAGISVESAEEVIQRTNNRLAELLPRFQRKNGTF